MQPILSRIKINALFDLKDIDWHINKRVSVLFGANGTGKSTILRLVNFIMNDSGHHYDRRKAKEIYLTISDNEIYQNLGSNTFDNRSSQKLIDTLKNELSTASNDKIKDSILNTLNLIESMTIAKKDFKLPTSIKKFRIEYLSTFDMTIMSRQEYDSVSDDVFTQLDFEIKKEIATLTGKMLSLSHKSASQIND